MKDIFLELTKSLKDIVLQFVSEVILLYKSFKNWITSAYRQPLYQKQSN
jgi:hypothetical protein